MDKYSVRLSSKAHRELDKIYAYIANELVAVHTAQNLIDEVEKSILGLDVMPYRGSERTTGAFANKGYRQIYVKNFTIVYKIDEKSKQVIIVTVRYTPSRF